MSVRKSMAWALSGNAVFFLIQFVGSVIAARLLSPEEVGVFSIAFSTMVLITAFQNLGFQSFIVREPELGPDKLGTVFTMAGLQACALALLLFLGAYPLSRFMDEPRIVPALHILCLFALLTPFETVLNGLLQRDGRFDLATIVTAARVVTSATATIALALLGWSYAAMSWGSSIAAAAAAIVALVLTRGRRKARPTLRHWRDIWKYGAHILATMSLTNLFGRLPDIVLGKLLGIAAVGLYGRAAGVIDSFVVGVMYSFDRVMLKTLVDSRDETGRVDYVYLRCVRICTALFWPMFAGLAVLAGPVIRLIYGAQWVAAAPVLSLLCIAAIVQTSISSRNELFIATSRVGELPRLEAIHGSAGLAFFTAGATMGLVPAAATRLLDAGVLHVTYARRVLAAADIKAADLYKAYLPSIVATTAAVLPSLALMTWQDWSDTVPIAFVAAAVLAGVLLWLATLYLVRHDLRSEVGRFLAMARPMMRRGA